MNEITTKSGRDFNAKNYVGESIAIVTKEYRPSIPTPYGKRPAWKVDVQVMSGPDESSLYENVLLFQKSLIDRCDDASDTDGTVIGTLGTEPTGYDDNFRYVVEEPSSAEIRLAARYGV